MDDPAQRAASVDIRHTVFNFDLRRRVLRVYRGRMLSALFISDIPRPFPSRVGWLVLVSFGH